MEGSQRVGNSRRSICDGTNTIGRNGCRRSSPGWGRPEATRRVVMLHRRGRVIVRGRPILSPLSASPLLFDAPDPDLLLWDDASSAWVSGPLPASRLRMKIVAEEGAWVTVMPFAYLKDRTGT